jgi:hypothetical protein
MKIFVKRKYLTVRVFLYFRQKNVAEFLKKFIFYWNNVHCTFACISYSLVYFKKTVIELPLNTLLTSYKCF